MSIKIIENIFIFAGGIGMFLYGMNKMADGLQKSAGSKMKGWLAALTKNRFLAVGLGALITAVIQSSSATTVMVVGFVNAGIMNLTQAVGIIMGANIGTTITAWIVSMGEWSKALKPEFIAPFLIAIGSFTILFAKSEKKKNIAQILIGFGFLFVGLSFMGNVIGQYSQAPIFRQAFITLGKNPILAILVGLVVTGIIQSSSASVGILQALAMSGLISWSSAIFITLGQNIGTCVTALISSIGASKTAKRAATIHLLFNVLGSIIFGLGFFLVFKLNPAYGTKTINSVQISLFHTFFNLGSTLILFPLANQLVKLSGFLIDDSKETQKDDEIAVTMRHLDDRILESPAFALENAAKEIIHMGEITLANVVLAIDSFLEKDAEGSKMVFENEKLINAHSKLLNEYLVKINNLSLSKSQTQTINRLYHIVSNIERVGDHAENIAEIGIERVENKILFSEEAYRELKEVASYSLQSFKDSIEVLKTEDQVLITQIEKLEEKVDQLEEELREKHLQRLSKGVCESDIGVLFIDSLTNLERISDHALNIASYIKASKG